MLTLMTPIKAYSGYNLFSETLFYTKGFFGDLWITILWRFPSRNVSVGKLHTLVSFYMRMPYTVKIKLQYPLLWIIYDTMQLNVCVQSFSRFL